MARLTIDTGTAGNPATGDTLRTAMTKINANFQELYNNNAADGLLTTSVTNGDVRIQPNGTGNVEVDQLQISDSTITPITTNASLTLQSNGTGTIILSDNSSVQGTFGVSGNVTFDGSLNRIGDFTFTGNEIKATRSNDNLKLSASGTGAIELESISINDNSITATRSNDDLNLSASGSGTINLQSSTNVNGLLTSTLLRVPRFANESAANTAYGSKVGGEIYYDTGSNQLKGWNGSIWYNLFS